MQAFQFIRMVPVERIELPTFGLLISESRIDFIAISFHCCPVQRWWFCKMTLQHKGFLGGFFGADLSTIWILAVPSYPILVFQSGRRHVLRPNSLFASDGFCSLDEF
jgi:hypothetical protein